MFYINNIIPAIIGYLIFFFFFFFFCHLNTFIHLADGCMQSD